MTVAVRLPKLTAPNPDRNALVFRKMAEKAAKPPRVDEPAELPLGDINQEPELFQPRHDSLAYAPGVSEAHIARLARQPRNGSPLDPVTVAAIGNAWFLVDGHHRIEAYKAAGWAKDIPVEVRSSDTLGPERVEWAIGLSCADNGKDRLGLADSDKQTRAWQAVARDACGSKEKLAERYRVSERNIAYMRAAKKKLEDAGRDPEDYPSWRRARSAVRELEGGDAPAGDWDEKKRRQLAKGLKPIMDLNPSPRELLEALEVFLPDIAVSFEVLAQMRRLSGGLGTDGPDDGSDI